MLVFSYLFFLSFIWYPDKNPSGNKLGINIEHGLPQTAIILINLSEGGGGSGKP